MALPDHFEGEDVIITLQEEGTKTYVKNFEGKVLSWNVSGGASSTDEVLHLGVKLSTFKNLEKSLH